MMGILRPKRPVLGCVTAIGVVALASAGAADAAPGVSYQNETIKGIDCVVWSWTDSHHKRRTVALKLEGNGNTGHGGYAIQMTYYAESGGRWQKITVNKASGSDGGFGYFVSHERDRYFGNDHSGNPILEPIARYVFGIDDSPLGDNFPATAQIVQSGGSYGAESFVITYGHYGTTKPHGIDLDTGYDSPPLTKNKADFAFYDLPVTTTWVFQNGRDFPRLDISVDLSQVIPKGGTKPRAGLVSFDVRGPYGALSFDGGTGDAIAAALWGDETNIFATTATPVTRSSSWTWAATNGGARYNALIAGSYEMGLFEPKQAASSATADGYSAERGFTSANFPGTSVDSCSSQTAQTLPSDGDWPYQSVQYSLPCTGQYLTTPTDGTKIAWGSSSYYGTTLTEVYNGYESLSIKAFPASHKLTYSVCVVLASGVTAQTSVTAATAAAYAPTPAKANCATAKY